MPSSITGVVCVHLDSFHRKDLEQSGFFLFLIMREFAQAFYKSQAWKKTAAEYTKAAAGLCERCLERGRISPGEIVHHRVWLTPENISDPDIALGWKNLQLVCRKCHGEIHAGEKRYSVDERGRVAPLV